MKLEDQVASLELCKKLKELGVRRESAFYWNVDGSHIYLSTEMMEYEHYSAFTVAELGEMLPDHIADSELFSPCITKRITTKLDKWGCNYYGGIEKVHPFEWITAETEAGARAKMLIHLLEKGIVKP